MGTEPSARGVPVNARSRLAGRSRGLWPRALLLVLTTFVLVLRAAVADAATGQPPGTRARPRTAGAAAQPGPQRGRRSRQRASVIRRRAARVRPAPPQVPAALVHGEDPRPRLSSRGWTEHLPLRLSPVDREDRGLDIDNRSGAADAIFKSDKVEKGDSDAQRIPDILPAQWIRGAHHDVTCSCGRSTLQRLLDAPSASCAEQLRRGLTTKGQKVCATAGPTLGGHPRAPGPSRSRLPYWTDAQCCFSRATPSPPRPRS